ncbi:MAG TPA: TonB-dependent receptor, partial [Vicinamibacterales bacterium]|nr:TonB-dependent receptor [Vicinamibacterales bacterium]
SPPSAPILNFDVTFSGANVVAKWNRQLGVDADATLQMYWDHTHQIGAQANDTLDTVDVDYVQRVPWGPNHLTFGAGARVSPDRFTQVIATTTFVPANRTLTWYSVFAQDELQLGRTVSLTVGSKFERNNYTGLEAQPTVRALWHPSDRQTLWAALTRAARTPSRLDEDFDLFLLAKGTPPFVYANVVGNPAFDAEVLVGSEAGYRTLVASKVFLDLTAFHNRYNGLEGIGNTRLSFVTGPGVPHVVGTLPWVNSVDGTTDGVEVSGDWRAFPAWRLQGAYSYLHLDLTTQPGFTDLTSQQTYLGSSPHHEVTLTSQVLLPKAIEFDQTYRFVSALPAQDVSAYNTADVRLGWRPRTFRHLEVSVVGQNLFAVNHPEFEMVPTGLVGIRRTVYGNVLWTK